jgi:hypothetical protein
MTIPTSQIIERLGNKGFMRKIGTQWTSQAVEHFIPLPVKDLILRYRVILAGYLNYFSFVDNRTACAKIF